VQNSGRTIPTHVGRTFAKPYREFLMADHPHARGENAICRLTRSAVCGPSPRTWGEQPEPGQPCQGVRTIPTHVGRTAQSDPRSSLAADHPHARGENTKWLR